MEYVKYKDVFASSSLGDIAFLKSVLDSKGIVYYFHGENFSRMRPLVQPARLMVDEERVEEVLDIIKDLKLSYGPKNKRGYKD